MVCKGTMALQLSFEYCIDPKDHKSEKGATTSGGPASHNQ